MITEQINLGNKIHKLRLDLGETMEQFGERFNTSKGTVNNWEKGRNSPNKENLRLLATIAGVSVQEFVFGVSKEEEEKIYSDYLSSIENRQKREFVKNLLFKESLEDFSTGSGTYLPFVESRLEAAEDDYQFDQRMKRESTLEFLNNVSTKLHNDLNGGLLELANAISQYSLIDKLTTNEEKNMFHILLLKIPMYLQNAKNMYEVIEEYRQKYDENFKKKDD